MRDAAARVQDAFHRAGYTADGVEALLGPVAHAALGRDETVPARRATVDGGPLATLVRLFLLQLPVGEQAAGAALPLDAAAELGLVRGAGGSVRAALDVRPYGADDAPPDRPWWVVSDLGTGLDGVSRPLPPDHVLGIGGASTTLAQVAPRPSVGRALDVGTGCGVQALHLSRHAAHVTATDVLPRALALARLTADLSGVELDLREGSLYDPVEGERFDMVVANPPFVVGAPRTSTYRDSGLPGDDVCRRLVAGATDVLADDGWLVLLANWLHRRGEDWRERVGGWLPPSGTMAHVVQRDVEDPAAYVATWLRDGGTTGSPDYVAAYDEWLDGLERDGVEGIGFGWIVLQRTGTRATSAELLEWPHPVEQPLGPHLDAMFTRRRWLEATGDDELLQARLTVAEDVVQEQYGRPGAEDPEIIVLRQQRALRRAVPAGTELAAVVGACDGTLPLGAIVAAVAGLLGEAEADVRARVLPEVRELVAAGLLGRTPRRDDDLA